MKQISLCNEFDMSAKRTRKRTFLEERERVVPRINLLALIVPCMPPSKTGCPAYPAEVFLRTYFLQQWFGVSDPTMEEALYDILLCRQFAGLDVGSVVDAILITAIASASGVLSSGIPHPCSQQ